MNDIALFWQDPGVDDDALLDTLPPLTQNQVSEVVNALVDQGQRPTPERVAAVMRNLALPPLERELLLGLLMRHWWMIADEIESGDMEALQAHLDQAPVQNHPACVYMRGMIAGFSAGRWHGHIESFKETKRGCSVTPPIEEGIA